MNACYVLLHFPARTETFVSDEIDALRDAGAKVFTVSLEGGPGADLALCLRRARDVWTLRRVLALLAHRPRALAALLRGPLTLGYRLRLLAAAEEARRRGVDTVHAHFAYRSADGAEVIGRALGTGHSVTAHAHDIFVGNADLARRLAAARAVVTVCEYNRRHLEEMLGSAIAAKLHVIPCGTRIGERAAATEPAEPVVLGIGRLVAKKGFDDLVAALALLPANARPRLVLVGDGPQRGRLEALASDLGADVTFTGGLDHDATTAWLERATLFCLPCKVAGDGDRDSMPVVVKEAMAAGLAVVSTVEVGVPEMVVDGETGFLVPPGDPEALAGAIAALLADPARRRAMGDAGRRLVEARFDVRLQAKRLLEVLG